MQAHIEAQVEEVKDSVENDSYVPKTVISDIEQEKVKSSLN